MKLYQSEEHARIEAVMNSVEAATKAGFTTQVEDDGHVLCGKPDTNELVDIFPNGSWEWQNANEETMKMEEMSGTCAALLQMFLHSDENKKIFFENQGD
jgi:hypothetical protein